MVRAICRGRLGEVDGDDAAQRALLGVWRALESDREIGSVWGYAAATARYEVLNSYQDFARLPTPTDDVTDATWRVAADEPGPAEQAERRDEVAHARERVEALLSQLSPRQAEVMRASVLAERSTADAAAELGITPTGVRAAQVRAMAQMRELCGVRSTNPQALNLTATERSKRAWEAEKSRRADREAAVVPVGADAPVDDDPLDRAYAAVDALHGAVEAGRSPGAAAGCEANSITAVSADERLAEVAPMVRRMCRARLGPWDGDDAAQEVLLGLWRLQQRPAYSAAAEAAPLFGWAATNVRWQVLKAARDSSRRMVPVGKWAEDVWIDPQAGPEERAERRAAVREAQDRLAGLIPRLSLRERQVILASQFGTRSNGETGARLGISRQSAAVAKQNAIARMRELVGVTTAGSRAEQRAARYRESPEHQAAVARREAQQATLVAAAQRLPQVEPGEVTGRVPAVDGPARGAAGGAAAEASRCRWVPGRAGWPEEVHHAGRAAVRDGWRTADVVRELGVGSDLVKVWRRANSDESPTVSVADAAAGSTAELLARARRALTLAQARRSEVDAHARVFGAARGRGPVPDIIAEKAREAARRGWTAAEMERGFAINRATAKRWIAEELPPRDAVETRQEPTARPDADAEASTADDWAGRPDRVDGRDRAWSDDGRGEDPLERARAAVDGLHDAVRDGFVEVDLSPVADVECDADSMTAGECDADERTADAAGAA